MTPDEIRALDIALDRAIARLGDAFEVVYGDIVDALQKRIAALVVALQSDGGRVATNEINLGIARGILRDLSLELESAGYSDLVLGAWDDIGAVLEASGVQRAMLATDFSVESLSAIRDMNLAALREMTLTQLADLERIVLRGVVGAQDVAELLSEVQALLDTTVAQARTLYETALSEFTQAAIALGATGDPGEAFLFSGPVDGKIRPFCFDHVGRAYTRANIDALDNGQLDNTFLTRGGYNCRHMWRPIPQDDPMAGLADTGEIVDDYYRDGLRFAERARRGGR